MVFRTVCWKRWQVLFSWMRLSGPHLLDLARAANATRRGRRRPGQQLVRPSVQRILDAMIVTPAYVRNGRRDILATNRLGYALYSEAYIDPARPVNIPIRVPQPARTRVLPQLGERGK